MTEILHENPILVLFIIIATGYLIGKIRIGGFSLGVAAVLFAGLGISALDPKLALPQIVYILGLVLFVYSIGLSSGSGFVATLRKKGLRTAGFVGGILLAAAALTVLAANLLGIDRDLAVGMYAGAFTNTPALATVLDALNNASVDPVIGYSLAYPFGIMGVLASIFIFQKIWGEKSGQSEAKVKEKTLYSRTIRYTRQQPCLARDLAKKVKADISVSRIGAGKTIELAKPESRLTTGTLVTIVGNLKALDIAGKWMGETVTEGALELAHSTFHTRRVFLSNPKLAGRTLADLQLHQKWEVVATRIRRGDIDFVAHDDTLLELGDRIKIVGPYEKVQQTADYLGDSYVSSSELDILSFTIGISLGLIVGLVPIPLPGGNTFHLGAAGGTLLVALVLGYLGRTGRIVWQIPFSTSTTLRQIGLLLFLAGIGSQAGGSLASALSSPNTLKIIIAGGVLTLFVSLATLIIGYKFMKVPYWQLSGMLAGIQTQPAVLAYSNEQAPDEAPNVGYASVYPIAMIMKIILAQILLLVLAS